MDINEGLQICQVILDGIQIITIDGWMGSGKTYFKEQIKFNDLMKISLDDYIEKETGLYLEVFKYDELKSLINKSLEHKKKLLIDGVCINEILQDIDIEADFKVYIKQLDSLGEWYYEKYLDTSKSLEEVFQMDDEETSEPLFENMTTIDNDAKKQSDELLKARRGLFYDLVRYHRNYLPIETCDLLIEQPYRENN